MDSTLSLDHIVYAVPDVDAAVDDLHRALGVLATPGGRHEGAGTHNALLSLGGGAYLEVIGPDPMQPGHTGPRPFGAGPDEAPRLAGWAARCDDIDAIVASARSRGHDPGPAVAMSRTTPHGDVLRWRLTFPPDDVPLVPFLIDWGQTPHPSATSASGARLLSLHGEAPDVAAARRTLDALGAVLDLRTARTHALVAHIEGPAGRVELR